MDRIPVYVLAGDPISEAGVARQLGESLRCRLVSRADADAAQVAVVVADRVDDQARRLVREARERGRARVVLVAGVLGHLDLVPALETGAIGVVRRHEATPERLVTAVVHAAAGERTVPPDLLGRVVDSMARLHRHVRPTRGLAPTGLAGREIEVLRLVAEGLDTAEIARELSYSERTIKNVLHEVTTRLQLRNRPHAVAYAMRQGLI
ncbi:response regulator transcription factor [Motilibacter deserti]|uniref:Response regulator transcription factor n=1 Tax=Motilibacter deserti TaxID=2714956 RepID=A0ABX0GY68_9ACTN|nr:response regulator transcription factor [Motilibacter deserti]NHC15927.1 response regulator transcription factor [Motilibacter deserti]